MLFTIYVVILSIVRRCVVSDITCSLTRLVVGSFIGRFVIKIGYEEESHWHSFHTMNIDIFFVDRDMS